MNHRMKERSNELSGHEEFAAEIAAIQPRLYGFILRRLADREQTLEVLQRTNLVICQKANDFEHGSSFVAWAFTIAKFQILAWRKCHGAGRLVFTDKVHEILDRATDEEVASVDDRIPLLNRCLTRLRDRDRELVQRRYRDGEPLARIAQSLAKSVDAIGMRLTRIRRKLAECVRARLDQETQT